LPSVCRISPTSWSSAAKVGTRRFLVPVHTDKKENQVFLIYREIQTGAVAKSYITNDLLIYGEYFRISSYFRKPFPHLWLCNCSTLNFHVFEETLIFFFISASFVIRSVLISEKSQEYGYRRIFHRYFFGKIVHNFYWCMIYQK
jgi:hypothetical protein